MGLFAKLTGVKGGTYWVPSHEGENVVPLEALPTAVRAFLEPQAEIVRAIGFRRVAWVGPSEKFRQDQQAGSFYALHDDGQRFAFAAHIVPGAAAGVPPQSALAVAVFLDGTALLGVTNQTTALDRNSPPASVILPGADFAALLARLERLLPQYRHRVRTFASWDEMHAHHCRVQDADDLHRIRRGLLVPAKEAPAERG